MPTFIRVGSRLVRTETIQAVHLDAPALRPREPEGVRIDFEHVTCFFAGEEAEALRLYFGGAYGDVGQITQEIDGLGRVIDLYLPEDEIAPGGDK